MKSLFKVLAVTAVALIVFLVMDNNPDEDHLVTANTPSSTVLHKTELSITSEEPSYKPSEGMNEVAGNVTNTQIDTTIRENRVEENKLEWRKVTPEFKEFMELSNKPLMSIADKDRLAQLMYETKLVDASRKILLKDVNEKELDLVQERQRLDSIEYLTTLLVGKYNSPLLDSAKQLALDALYHDNVKPEQNLDLRRSLVGDKVELGMVLAVYHADAWESYKTNAPYSEKHAKLVEYIDQLALVKADQLSSNALKLAQRLKKIKEG